MTDVYAAPTDGNCQTCGNSREWHQENQTMHSFNDGQAGAAAFLGMKRRDRGNSPGDNGNGAQRGSQTAPWPFDPVLRQALIDKGVLTPEDLRDAEDKIRAVTAQFTGITEGSRNGQ